MKKVEYLDLVNENDEVIGVEDRDTIYKKGLQNYRVVNCFVIDNFNRILLPKRDMKRKIFPGCYDFSCGEHVVSGESYDDAVYRGLSEELNITGFNPILLKKLTPKDGISSFMQIYKLHYDGEINPNKNEGVESYDFYNLVEIQKMIDNNPKSFKEDIPKVLKFVEKLLF